MDKITELEGQLQKLRLDNSDKQTEYENGKTFVKIQITSMLARGNISLPLQLARTHVKYNILSNMIDRLGAYDVPGRSIEVKNTQSFNDGVLDMKRIAFSIVSGYDTLLEEAGRTIIYNVLVTKIMSIRQLCK